MLRLSLIVLRCSDLDATRAFYTTLGFAFQTEQHGKGPVHYSCQVGDMVLELYPGKPGSAPGQTEAGACLHGFQVDSLDAILTALQPLKAEIVHFPSESPWGRRAVVLDPDGRAIELTQPRL